jgi:hypothetical protein
MIKYRLCKRKLHELRPENILWSMGIHGKYQRACRKCNNEARKRNPKRLERNRARAKKRNAARRAAKLRFLNASGIIQGLMLG